MSRLIIIEWFFIIFIALPLIIKFISFLQISYMHFSEKRMPKAYYKLAEGFKSTTISNCAGCLVEQNDKILIVWSPFNFHNIWSSWKYSIPGGKSKSSNELAYDVAARETFEETGINVEICDEIIRFSNGFVLFHAKPIEKIDEDKLAKYKKTFEVSSVLLTDLKDIKKRKARFPDQHDFIVNWIESRKNKQN